MLEQEEKRTEYEHELPNGTVLDGKYKILNKIDKGGMSVIYLAINESANQTWAVKVVRRKGKEKELVVKQNLVAERRILTKLRHDNLPRVVDVIETEDSLILVMDYIEGKSLDKVLEERGPQSQELVIEWAKQLCEVYGYLHSQTPPIIYRDMKPNNVMLKPDGHHVVLIDFGTAREYRENSNKVSDTTCLGTPGYAAPEQWEGADEGQSDARTDIYALGATMHHLLTGIPPSKSRFLFQPIREINESFSKSLEDIIIKCTQMDPRNRYQSAAELMYALEQIDLDDDNYRKKQTIKLGAFITTLSLSVIMGITSVWGYLSAEQKKGENYDQILLEAETQEDYFQAILTDPTRTDAYLEFGDFLTDDYVVTKEERELIQQLQIGLKRDIAGGFQETVDVLSELRTANRDGYAEVCFRMGWDMLAYYDTDIDRVRYANAARWFRNIRDDGTENGSIASIFCDISDCMTEINELRGGKVIQTEQTRIQWENLWEMLQSLMVKANTYSTDFKLQTWIEVANLIDRNAKDILEVANPDALKELLHTIQSGMKQLDTSNEDLRQLIIKLDDTVQRTLDKVDTVVR